MDKYFKERTHSKEAGNGMAHMMGNCKVDSLNPRKGLNKTQGWTEGVSSWKPSTDLLVGLILS